ncbi:uncharacterized protein LOC101858035 [Aplysia californica]|uniref:Uncharacterized protein LOC101858035 n=1 Tax=Aplysia californica TaxID=6500 RepID=A0ABM1A1C5_APLCA|nr:uncharacterized protein LOC101858035 [Aplysia californica]
MQTCTYETKAIVTGYVAKYCKEHECNDTSKIQKVDVPANVSHCTLSGLTTKQTYLLTVQSKSHRRFGVEAHPWKSAIVREGNEEASNVPLIIVITAAVFLVLAVLAVAFYMTRERCKKFKSLTLEQDFKDVILKDNPKRTPASSFQGNVIPSSECACDVPPEVPQRTVVSNSEPSVLFEVQDESVQDQADVTSGPDSSWWDNSGAPLIKEPVKGDKQKGKKNCKAAKTIPIDVVEMTDSPAGGSTVVSPSHSCHSNVELLPAESTAPTGFTVQENACPVHSVSKLSDATVITPSTVLVTHVPSQGYITGSNQQSLHCSSSSSSGSSRQNVNEYVVSEQSARPKDRPEDSDVIEAINFSPDYVTADSPSVLADSDLAVVPEVKVGRKLTEPHDMGMTSPSTGVYTNKLPLTDVDFPEERETQLTQGNNDQLGEISYSPHPVQAVALCEVGLPMYVQSGGGGTAHTASGVNGEEESLQRHDVGCLSLLDTGGVNQDRLCDSASDSELGSFDVPHSDDEGHNGEESSDEDRHYYDNRDNDDGYTVHID